MLTAKVGHSQSIVCTKMDSIAFYEKMAQLDPIKDAKDYGDSLGIIGKTFIDIPYVAKTLEVGQTESLVINLHGLDCTTFVENVLAFGKLVREGKGGIADFLDNLEEIRYEDGKLDGYASRLHYFSYWMANNEKKGLIKDITREMMGSELRTKEINFMGTHRDLYPFLRDDKNFDHIRKTESALYQQPLCLLPQDRIAANEHLIKTGDIIALTTSIKGLDVTHTGIASRESDGRIHLLHASTSSMKVEVTKLPLVDYLRLIKSNTGIMVGRPL
tara:strand:+ start:67702 stop:68520 length:819 start_codon:yes stop_codon:yes gene_type:complete